MDSQNFYMGLPFDLAGARSKNRFRNEILWGLEKIYEIYKLGQDFRVVFDYVCDIEIHLDTSYEFYQVKTRNNASPYSLSQLLKPDKAGKSVLGKLYILKQKSDENKAKIKIAIVSNTALKGADKKLHSSCGEKEFITLSNQCKDTINKKLTNELSLSTEVNLQDVCYIYTSMDLFNPQNSLLGQTVNFFIDVKGEEPKKPKALFRMLSDTIIQKASHELVATDYDSLIANKGITKGEVDDLLNKFTEKIDVAVSKSLEYIENKYTSYKKKVEMKNALSKIVRSLLKSQFLKQQEIEIVNRINTSFDELDMELDQVIEYLFSCFSTTFTVEYTETEIKAMLLLILMRYEEGIYE